MRTNFDRLADGYFYCGMPVGAALAFGIMGLIPISAVDSWWFGFLLLLAAASPIIGFTAIGYWLDLGKRIDAWLSAPAKPTGE